MAQLIFKLHALVADNLIHDIHISKLLVILNRLFLVYAYEFRVGITIVGVLHCYSDSQSSPPILIFIN